MTVYVTGPRDKHTNRPAGTVVNTTSCAGWSSDLSPFKLGPCRLYEGAAAEFSQTMENLWQYAKVYAQHARDGEPTEQHFIWAVDGWNNSRAERYPMGRGAKPLYALWRGEKLGYIDARKRIYVPEYANVVVKTAGWNHLQEMASRGDVVLWDFDGYNHKALGRDWQHVLNDPMRPCGHAFVLCAILDGELKI